MYKFEVQAETMEALKLKILDHAQRLEPVKKDAANPLDFYKEPESSPTQVTTSETQVSTFTPQARFQDAPTEEAKFSSDVETDSNGLPWDERIHASSKAKTKDGTWRTKRGVDASLIKQVEAEISTPKQEIKIPEIPKAVGEVPQIPTFQNSSANLVDAAKEGGGTQSVPQIPQPNGQQNVGLNHDYASFKQNLIPIFAELQKQNKINQEYIDQLKAHFQVKEIWNLLASEKQCQDLYDLFIQHGIIFPAEYK